jgi:hypothetical protein
MRFGTAAGRIFGSPSRMRSIIRQAGLTVDEFIDLL